MSRGDSIRRHRRMSAKTLLPERWPLARQQTGAGLAGVFAKARQRLSATGLRSGPAGAAKVLDNDAGSAPSLGVLALGRAGFGATPEDLDSFRSLGEGERERLEAWVDSQLDPDAIPDDVLEARLAESELQTLDKSLAELWLDHQLEDEDFDLRMLPAFETQSAAVLRATYSRRQLAEVLADFWHNHFNVFGWHELAGPVFVHYDRDVIRANMLGSFRRFLEEVTAAPAMLVYLDNAFSAADGPNENFAREVLELHTLGEQSYYGAIPASQVPRDAAGVPLGYVDEDVRELARCLTGWSLDPANGAFLYRSGWHDEGAKSVLGLDIPARQPALDDVRAVLDLLARHEATARFVCTKLCRRLVADHPPESLVQDAVSTFLESAEEPDQLRRVVRTILLSEQFATTWGDKVKRPFELVVSAIRTMGPSFALPVMQESSAWFFWLLWTTGNLPYAWGPPTGYPDQKEDWLTTNALVASWRLVNLLTWYGEDGFRVCDPLSATPADLRSAEELADYWIQRVLNRPVDEQTRREVVELMAQGRGPDIALDLDDELVQDRLRSMVGLLATSPDFHWR